MNLSHSHGVSIRNSFTSSSYNRIIISLCMEVHHFISMHTIDVFHSLKTSRQNVSTHHQFRLLFNYSAHCRQIILYVHYMLLHPNYLLQNAIVELCFYCLAQCSSRTLYSSSIFIRSTIPKVRPDAGPRATDRFVGINGLLAAGPRS